jgi:hypothetical protein
MHIDNSYTPLRADFDQFVSGYFGKHCPTVEQREAIRSVFYAGAAAAYGIIIKAPDKADTLRDELADQMERLERQKLKV